MVCFQKIKQISIISFDWCPVLQRIKIIVLIEETFISDSFPREKLFYFSHIDLLFIEIVGNVVNYIINKWKIFDKLIIHFEIYFTAAIFVQKL